MQNFVLIKREPSIGISHRTRCQIKRFKDSNSMHKFLVNKDLCIVRPNGWTIAKGEALLLKSGNYFELSNFGLDAQGKKTLIYSYVKI